MKRVLIGFALLFLMMLVLAPSSADFNSDSNFSSGANIFGGVTVSADFNHHSAIGQPFTGRTSSADFITILGYLVAFATGTSSNAPVIVSVSPSSNQTIASSSQTFAATVTPGDFPVSHCIGVEYKNSVLFRNVSVAASNNVCSTSVSGLAQNDSAYVIWTAYDTSGVPSASHTTGIVTFNAGGDLSTLLPDLAISSLTADWNGGYADVNVVVVNSGNAGAGGFEVALFEGSISNPPIDTQSVSGLNVGESTKLEYRIPFSGPGTHTIIAFADSSNSVSESNESNNLNANNFDSIDIIVPSNPDLPDLAMGSVFASLKGSTLSLDVEVSNDGNAGTGLFGVAVYYNNFSGLLLSRQVVNGLTAGASTTSRLSFEVDLNSGIPSPGTISFAGPFSLSMFLIADDQMDVPESDRSDNSKILTISLSSEGEIIDQNETCTENCGPPEPPGPPGSGGIPSPNQIPGIGTVMPGSVLHTVFGNTLGNGTIYDVLAGGLNAVFLGALGIIAPWEFLILFILALIAAYLTFRMCLEILFEQALVLAAVEERKRLAVRVGLAVLFFFVPFGVATFLGFVTALVWALIEIVFWPLARYGKQQWQRGEQEKSLTLESEPLSKTGQEVGQSRFG